MFASRVFKGLWPNQFGRSESRIPVLPSCGQNAFLRTGRANDPLRPAPATRQETMPMIAHKRAPGKHIMLFQRDFLLDRCWSIPARRQEIKVLTATEADADPAYDIHRICG
jgi:hypothetical protein